ncbi:MAG: hypothetical protein WCR21_10765, partial [Bacteroidota bacterium]
YDFYRRPKLIDYAIILAPFYKTDEKVKQYFNKLSKIKSQNIAMPLLIVGLKQGIVINDSLQNSYWKSNFTKTYFYSELEKENLLSHFNTKTISQKALVESLLSSEYQLSKYYAANGQKIKNDTISFVEQLYIENKYQKGDLYIYKKPTIKTESEAWMIVFVPITKEKITTNMSLISANYYIDPTLSLKENLKNMTDYFSVRYRKRAGEYFDNNQQDKEN